METWLSKEATFPFLLKAPFKSFHKGTQIPTELECKYSGKLTSQGWLHISTLYNITKDTVSQLSKRYLLDK